MSNSGCNYKIKGGVFYKSNGEYPLKRLILQTFKQDDFKFHDYYGIIKTPEIYGYTISDNKATVRMEYIKGKLATDYILENDIDKCISKLQTIKNYINFNLVYSENAIIPNHVFHNKLDEITSKTNIKFGIQIPDLVVPTGYYHGDLTLSNMFWETKDDSIYFFDFLDTKPDTPYWDIAKLQQDLKYRWFLRNQEIDLDLDWKLRRLSSIIDSGYDLQTLKYFEYMTLARILPYVNKQTQNWIINKLGTIDV